MKKIRKRFMLFLTSMILTSGMTVFAGENIQPEVRKDMQTEIEPRSGCGKWQTTYKTPYCSIELCPGAYKRRLRNVEYKRVCVRENNSQYLEKKEVIKFVACDCL